MLRNSVMIGESPESNNKISFSIDRNLFIAFVLGLIVGYLLHRWISEKLYYNVPEPWQPNPYYNPYHYSPRTPRRTKEVEDFEEPTKEKPSKEVEIKTDFDEYAQYEI